MNPLKATDEDLLHDEANKPDWAKSELPWLLTKTGKRVDFLDPKPGQITIEDIAWALAGKPRFNGHTVPRVRYSIAQHSCLVHDRIQGEHPDCWATRLSALLHDAPEAYLPDLHTQLKTLLTGFRDLEGRFAEAISERYGLPDLSYEKKSEIKKVDRRMLATERRDLMAPGGDDWATLTGAGEPYATEIKPWPTETAYHEFLYRYGECIGLMPCHRRTENLGSEISRQIISAQSWQIPHGLFSPDPVGVGTGARTGRGITMS